MGYNSFGEIGDGSTTQRTSPVQVVASGVLRLSEIKPVDPNSDADGDGFTYAQETEAGTDPDSNASKPGLNFGLVAYYPFDGNANDMTGNGHHGTVNGATLDVDRHGSEGKAYAFDGDDWIEVNHHPTIDFEANDPFALSLWVKVGSGNSGPSKSIVEKWSQPGARPYPYVIRYENSPRLIFNRYDSNNSNGVELLENIFTEDFAQVIVSSDGSTVILYANGIEKGSATISTGSTSNSHNLYFGRRGGIEPCYFNGSIDDVRIYDRALSAVEVAALYQLEKPNATPIFAGPATFTTAENNASASFLVGATDADANTTLVYSKSGPDADKFTLNVATGELTFANPPDYEANGSAAGNNAYAVTVTVSDGTVSATQAIMVNVTDLYEPSNPNHTAQAAANLEMIWVEPGTFTMGSPVTEANRGSDENQTQVTLTQGFYLGKYEVTQAQYEAVMIGNSNGLSATPSQFGGNPNRPVEKVIWSDAQVFLTRLNAAEQAAGRLPQGWRYVLPTEAQWEYACRAGTTTVFSHGNSLSSTQANFKGTSPYGGAAAGPNLQRTTDVGSYAANPWGFHDMHGNVWEWCADWKGDYPAGSATDPTGPASGSLRVLRGGSWGTDGHGLRSASRHDATPGHRSIRLGFRLAFVNTMPPGSVTTAKLDPGLLNFLDGNGTIEQALPAGTVIARKPGDPAPAGYTFFQRNEYNATLIWEEKAPVSVGRYAGDGLVSLNGKIYFIGGYHNSPVKTFERYDPSTNQWETLPNLQDAREGLASAVLDGKIYAMGGTGFSSVEIFDPLTNQWSYGPNLPKPLDRACALSVNGKIFLTGGRVGGAHLTDVYEFDPLRGTWVSLSPLSYSRAGHRMVLSKGRIWVLGGNATICESYDFASNTWRNEAALNTVRSWPVAWSSDGDIFVGGGNSPGSDSIEILREGTGQWLIFQDKLPVPRYAADAIVYKDKVFIVSGKFSGSFSRKVYAADLPVPAMHLYFKDGNATAEAATSPPLDGNLSVTLNMLAPDVLAKLDVNQTHAHTAGSVIAVPKDSAPPAGYSLYKRSDRNGSLVWEEKAPVSLGRAAQDGVVTAGGKVYFFGGTNGSSKDILERYDPAINQWETLNPMSEARSYFGGAVLDNKLYAIGGAAGVIGVQVFDVNAGQWSTGPSLPNAMISGTAITAADKIFMIGGKNLQDQSIDQVLELDTVGNQWIPKASMPTSRHALKLVWFENRIWAIGGRTPAEVSVVESYDPHTNTWRTEPSLSTPRGWASAWVANNKIYVAGGVNNGNHLDSIEIYEPNSNQWTVSGILPQNLALADAAVLNGKVYLVAGNNGLSFSNKVFAADVTPPMDLYFRDANASGTITLDKLDGTVVSKLDGNASASPPIGAVSAVDHNDAPPAEHALLERTDRNATHVWEEKAQLPEGILVFDGLNAVEGKIYLTGGQNEIGALKSVRTYDPSVDAWAIDISLSTNRSGISSAVLDGKIFAISGNDSGVSHTSVEILDRVENQWNAGPALPNAIRQGAAIVANGKLFVMGGINESDPNSSYRDVWELDANGNQWVAKTPMPLGRHGLKLLSYGGKIWAYSTQHLQIYDVAQDSWTLESGAITARHIPLFWESNGYLYVGGGLNSGDVLQNIERYDPKTKQWSAAGLLPEPKYIGGSVTLDNRVFIVAGRTTKDSNNSAKVYAADLIPHRDLYFREADATAPAQPAPNQPPAFTGAITFTTAENNVSASFIVGATDPDANTTLVYSKSGPDADKFTLNVATGELTFVNPPDFEANASAAGNNAYSVTVTVTDGEANATQAITVNVTDVPEFSPPFITLSNGILPENNPPGSTIGQFSLHLPAQGLVFPQVQDSSGGDSNSSPVSGGSITAPFVTTADMPGGESVVVFTAPAYNLTNGLVAHYPFDGNASDVSGNANHGTVHSASLGVDRHGRAEKAYNFDGVDDRIRIADSALNGASSFALSLWLKSVPNRQQHVLSGANHSRNNEFLIELSANHSFDFYFKDVRASGANVPTIGWDLNWTQLLVSRASISEPLKVYTNGVWSGDLNPGSGSPAVSPNGLWMGADQDSVGGGWQSGQFYKGSMDDLRIYDRALSASEVTALYELEKPIDPNSDADGDGFTLAQETAAGTDPDSNASKPGLNFGLVAHYPFDGNASDASGNGNHGTVHGATLGPDRHGAAGKAYSFDGVDDYIQIANSAELNPSEMTVSAWYKATSSFYGVGHNAIIQKPFTSHTSPFYQWSLFVKGNQYAPSGQFWLGIYDYSGRQAKSVHDSVELLNNWVHLTGVIKPDAQKSLIFFNGQIKDEVSLTAGAIPAFSTDVYIGRLGNLTEGTSHTPAAIDDVRIYDRALSAAEVAALYELERPKGVSFFFVDGNGSTDNGLFTLDGNGTLKAKQSFDYEVRSTYSVRVQANLDGMTKAEGDFTISITDMVENLPPSDLNLSGSSLAENRPIGTVVGSFNAIDPDDLNGSGQYLFSFVDGNASADNSAFTLDGAVLRAAASFDYETKNSYSIRVRVTDDHNASLEKTFSISVTDLDDHPPVITLLGDANVTHEAVTPYADAGASWTDTLDGNGSLEANGTVNVMVPGVYVLTYSRTDAAGNVAATVTRTVRVRDTTIPTITLLGDANVTHEAATPYADAGASWTDALDGNGSLEANGTVNVMVPGVYVLSYSRTDAAGNVATTVTRTVRVRDGTVPVLALLGDANVTLEAGSAFSDLGAVWTDLLDGSGTVFSSDLLDTRKPGRQILTYRHADLAGNLAVPVTRNVTVADTTAPVVRFKDGRALGPARLPIFGAPALYATPPLFFDEGAPPADFGFVWTDAADGNGTALDKAKLTWRKIVGSTGDLVNPDPAKVKAGRYWVLFELSDSSGNAAEPFLRMIQVLDVTAPVITLNGPDTLRMAAGLPYLEQGALRTDDVDGNGSVYPTGTVDANQPGVYVLTYSYADAAGNAAAPKTRTVTVYNDAPTDVKMSASSVEENLPAGTLVGRFSTIDPNQEGNRTLVFTYELTKGDADFTLDANGSLRTKRPFDYESEPVLALSVRTSDGFGGNLEKTFEVAVVDAFVPIVETLTPVTASQTGRPMAKGEVLDAGGSLGVSERGFVVGATPDPDVEAGADKALLVLRAGQGTGPYEASLAGHNLPAGQKLYLRAYAKNAEGVSYGTQETITFAQQDFGPAWADAQAAAGAANWWNSPWFGTFYLSPSGWLTHDKLGWLYAAPASGGGVWLWREERGWLWTERSAYPFLFERNSGSWLYLFGTAESQTLLYRYSDGLWFDWKPETGGKQE